MFYTNPPKTNKSNRVLPHWKSRKLHKSCLLKTLSNWRCTNICIHSFILVERLHHASWCQLRFASSLRVKGAMHFVVERARMICCKSWWRLSWFAANNFVFQKTAQTHCIQRKNDSTNIAKTSMIKSIGKDQTYTDVFLYGHLVREILRLHGQEFVFCQDDVLQLWSWITGAAAPGEIPGEKTVDWLSNSLEINY